MKKPFVILFAGLATGIGFTSPGLFADEIPAEKPKPSVPLMMSEEGLKERQEHLLKMHDLSNRILAAKDPKIKQKLKDEQLSLMKEFEILHHERMQKHMQEMMNKNPRPPEKPMD